MVPDPEVQTGLLLLAEVLVDCVADKYTDV